MARNGAAAKRVDDRDVSQHLNEVAGVLTLAVALFALVSFCSYHLGLKTQLGGVIGDTLSTLFAQTFGVAIYLLPMLLAVVGWRLFRTGLADVSLARAGAALTLLLSSSALLGLIFTAADVGRGGGWFGGFVATLLFEGCGSLGAYVVVLSLLLLALMFTTGSSVRSVSERTANRWREAASRRRERRASKAAAAAAVRAPIPGITNRKRSAPTGNGPLILLEEDVAAPPKRRREAMQEALPFLIEGDYSPPSSNLLDEPRHSGVRVDEEQLRRSSEILENKLANFGIEGKVVAVRPGPVITTFEIEPAPGVKVNRIVTLQDDLAMALRAMGVRILAPIPGKAVVGIEVANAKREQVYLSEMIESDLFQQMSSTLTLALGKDSAGVPVVGDLARMPHLLIAGATGTGKSVSLNAMIMSILLKASPRDVRFVMIDLKMLELSLYEDLPHQLVPVVTDPKKAVVVLKNLCVEMDRRYVMLKEKGVRNIDSYNRMLEQELGPGVIELTEIVDNDDDIETTEPQLKHEHLPKIVVIIDELADLMMTAGRHVEEPITRLAQKARACGIHLILATQRPSVDVITGLIKANFPARMSFQVTARVDSRTILDCIGAERLLGGGDMLFLPPGTARVQRLHGAFVSEAEIKRVTTFVKQQARPQYAFELLEGEDEEAGGGGLGGDEEWNDAMYDQAVRVVTESRIASISYVQRRLRVGYNRAARMIERMEGEGVVSRSDNGKPREVLAPPPAED
jgi:S-DNA-T family DNA segregation ATPase FtsK/SpoIIIE